MQIHTVYSVFPFLPLSVCAPISRHTCLVAPYSLYTNLNIFYRSHEYEGGVQHLTVWRQQDNQHGNFTAPCNQILFFCVPSWSLTSTPPPPHTLPLTWHTDARVHQYLYMIPDLLIQSQLSHLLAKVTLWHGNWGGKHMLWSKCVYSDWLIYIIYFSNHRAYGEKSDNSEGPSLP